MVSVWMEISNDDRQLLGFMEMNRQDLYGAMGNQYGKDCIQSQLSDLKPYRRSVIDVP
jgi:hypothetical protein